MTKRRFPTITLATEVTILRILGIPIFVLMMVYYLQSVKEGRPNEAWRMWGLGLFLAIALTDALDGYLARSRNEVTRLGIILDPIADKALFLASLILLTRPSLTEFQPQFPMAFTLLVISREVVLFGGAFIVDHLVGHVHIKPRWTGKVATFLMMLVITWVLSGWQHPSLQVVLWITAGLLLISGLQYIMDGIHQFESEEKNR